MIKSLKINPYLTKVFDILLDLFFIVFLSIFVYLSRPIPTSEVVFIPRGSTGEIISYLANRKFNVSAIDKYATYLLGRPQSGWIAMQSGELARVDFLKKLTTAKAALTQITLIPGETSIVFFNQIASQLNLDPIKLNAEFNATSPLPDGYLVPNTYKIPLGISEEHLVYYLLNSSKKAHEELSQKSFGEFDEKKWFKILTIASVIQKEAANQDEMPIVASVIYNRLEKGMRLQMDGTLNYGIYSHETITPERIRTDMSEFNTYLNDGLPPTPICAVSVPAIKAAINPAKTEFLFFVRDKKTKKHRFSKTLGEHNQNINSQR